MKSRPSRAGNAMLGPADPSPFELVNPDGKAPCLIVCDHASHVIPESLGDLGVAPAHRYEHIAWDIGAAVMARRLAERLDAPAVLAGFSRLVVDCNRYLDDPSAFVHTSDQVAVPGNIAMTDSERAQRVAQIYRPYHNAIDDALERFDEAGVTPAVIAVHTMTAQMRGRELRPQQFTMCWARDDRMALPVMDRLRAPGDIVVGDNLPYGMDLGEDYTVPEHAMRRGLPHLQYEVRQDLVTADDDAVAWADRIYDACADLVADPELRTVKLYWP
jgi:predicted N-formylglutamate amidohydrolase